MKAERKWWFVCPLLRFEAGAAGGAGGVLWSRREAGRRGGRPGAGGSPAQPGGVSHDVRLEAGAMASRGGQGRPARDGRPGMAGRG